MDELWASPAKVNLTLRVDLPRSDGYHPVESIVQTIEWCDQIRLEDTDDDVLEVSGADLPTGGDNLIWKAVTALEFDARDALAITLTKHIPAGAGLGGGSSNAATMIAALGDRYRIPPAALRGAASRVGADVTFFLTGGTARLEGYGEQVTRLDPIGGFVIVVLVPTFRLATRSVFQKWDELDHPVGVPIVPTRLPPALRSLEIINDMTPAAIALEPQLGDLMVELSRRWDCPVMMSGSGSGVFACFADADEAGGAAAAVGGMGMVRVCTLRTTGVQRLDR